MRYADNLASGNGLVWNPGERVEGFTNPLWTGYMAVWHLVGIPRAKTSLAIMLTSALILILNALAVYSIASRLSPESRTVARVAMVVAGTYWPLVKWSLEGFEVGLAALLTTIVTLETFVYMEHRRTRHLAAMTICLIALGWTRLEMLAVAGVPVAYLLLTDAARTRVIKGVIAPVAAERRRAVRRPLLVLRRVVAQHLLSEVDRRRVSRPSGPGSREELVDFGDALLDRVRSDRADPRITPPARRRRTPAMDPHGHLRGGHAVHDLHRRRHLGASVSTRTGSWPRQPRS